MPGGKEHNIESQHRLFLLYSVCHLHANKYLCIFFLKVNLFLLGKYYRVNYSNLLSGFVNEFFLNKLWPA